jgi:hypothetical protein
MAKFPSTLLWRVWRLLCEVQAAVEGAVALDYLSQLSKFVDTGKYSGKVEQDRLIGYGSEARIVRQSGV